MNAERLLAHYEKIADAPDAIARLRRFVLDLAVRGKLVPQDPNDEPASELLKRIAAEKARLVKAGEIRKPPTLEPITDTESLYALPRTWAWVRVGDIFDYDAGTKRDPKELDQSRWLLELEDIEKDTSRIVERLRVSDRDSQSTKSEFEPGDILYGKLRPYLNKVLVADEPGYSTTEIVAIRPFLRVCPEYCALAFRRPDFVAYVERLGRGTKMPRLRTPDAIVAHFPLPPLAEQRRIVVKVDELMALCDRLEAARQTREATRDKLAAASLARLNAPDPETFRDAARFALDALPALTARADQIKHLRQTILNLAVRGKLVPQDSKEEVAKRYLAEPRSDDLPPNWRLLNFEKFCDIQGGNQPPKSRFIDQPKEGYVRLLQIRDLGERPVPTFIPIGSTNRFCKEGEILIGRYGASVGKIFWAKDGAYNVALAKFIWPEDAFIAPFAFLLLKSAYFQDHLAGATRSAQAGFNKGDLAAVNFPLPPLGEQRRILAKVDELMALCDRLEASLASADDARRRLLEALLAEALAPADARELEAAE
jgi:type I restriction enzyme S subunit